LRNTSIWLVLPSNFQSSHFLSPAPPYLISAFNRPLSLSYLCIRVDLDSAILISNEKTLSVHILSHTYFSYRRNYHAATHAHIVVDLPFDAGASNSDSIHPYYYRLPSFSPFSAGSQLSSCSYAIFHCPRNHTIQSYILFNQRTYIYVVIRKPD
jgi:hypothetical protein